MFLEFHDSDSIGYVHGEKQQQPPFFSAKAFYVCPGNYVNEVRAHNVAIQSAKLKQKSCEQSKSKIPGKTGQNDVTCLSIFSQNIISSQSTE